MQWVLVMDGLMCRVMLCRGIGVIRQQVGREVRSYIGAGG